MFETVRQHLDKERAMHALGVKVLSLFFINKVANYRGADAEGNPTLGEIGLWFEEAYTQLAAQPRYVSLALPPVGQAHDGYFSVDNKGVYKDTRGTGEADTSTYDLIMRDKERLLSTEEPLRFIFSHSALREGWDNPNVFQICTLNDSKSTDRKRQEIGRGLRLPVNQAGERIHDPQINRLTVVANEAYDQFAAPCKMSTKRTPVSASASFPRSLSRSSHCRLGRTSPRQPLLDTMCHPTYGTTSWRRAISTLPVLCCQSSTRVTKALS